MKKKTLYFTILAVIIMVGVGIASFFLIKTINPTPTPVPTDTQSTTKINVEETAQAIEGQQYGAYFTNFTGERSTTDIVPLAAYTAAKYTKETFLNPYFITRYWEKEDDYALSSLETYIFPYVSDEIKTDLTTKVEDKSNIQSNFTGYTTMLEPEKTIFASCYDSWDTGYCFAGKEPTITNMAFNQLDEDTISVSTSFTIDVVYQKPDGLEGDSVIETRNYTVNYLMSIVNEPDSLDTTLPIMIIEEVKVESLDIQVVDFLINGEG